MPTFSHTQILGFAETVLQAIEGERTSLAALGIDADPLIKRLRATLERTVALNEKQEGLKREAVATTREFVSSIKALYLLSSGGLDILIATAGKTSDAAMNFRQLRSRVKKRRSPADAPDKAS